VIERRDLYIDGQWVTPDTGEVISVDEAATGEIIGTVPSGDATDAERAILAARRSAETWANVPISERADVVTAIAEGNVARAPGNVDVVGLGFISNMAEYMVAADILVTKAGPGTIAEATSVGLPVMITRFVPL